jgi:UDP-GlcNAc3NAcA epimerase
LTRKIVTVVGARPQFIKAATVSRAIRETHDVGETMVHTGQHFDADMSDVFFEELDIPEPKYRLNINGGGHGEMTGRMLEAIEPVLIAEKPDWVVVYGDTNSTLAGALAAAKLHIPIAHVEAGLRSYNRRMPEEINRVLTDHLSALHLCPTTAAVKNLAKEGVSEGVHQIGDVMYDATLFAIRRSETGSNILSELGLTHRNYGLATVHRAENTNDPASLGEAISFLQRQARVRPVVLPIHPRTRQNAQRMGVTFDGLKVVNPVGYLDMAKLLNGACEVFTDSGGLQKEAYFHRVSCTTLRDETEWVETIAHGWNRLWKGADFVERSEINEYGDGQAAFRIVELLRS